MKEQLKLLIRLQSIDTEIMSKNELIRLIPAKVSSAEQPLKEARILYEKQKQKCETLEKKKKEKDRSLDEADERLKKLKARTSEIKSNKEYQAHLKEISAFEKERSAVEDEILELMESLDAAHRELKLEEERLKAEKEKVEEFRRRLDEEVEAVKRDVEDLRRRRAECVKLLDKEIYELYFGILKSTGGLAVAGAKDEVCQGCNMNIPPQLFVELKRNERITQCPQCGRILYWKEEGDSLEREGSSAARTA